MDLSDDELSEYIANEAPETLREIYKESRDFILQRLPSAYDDVLSEIDHCEYRLKQLRIVGARFHQYVRDHRAKAVDIDKYRLQGYRLSKEYKKRQIALCRKQEELAVRTFEQEDDSTGGVAWFRVLQKYKLAKRNTASPDLAPYIWMGKNQTQLYQIHQKYFNRTMTLTELSNHFVSKKTGKKFTDSLVDKGAEYYRKGSFVPLEESFLSQIVSDLESMN